MQKEILSFLSICRAIVHYEQIEREINFYRDYQDLSRKEFDDDEYKELADSYTAFSEASNTMIGNYLNHAYSDLYAELVETLSSEEEAQGLFAVDKVFSVSEVKVFMDKAYEKIIAAYREGVDDVDDIVFFTNIIRNIINNRSNDTENAVICPYCGQKPDIVEAADFFGDDSKYDGKRVCCCECGAYALVNSNGDIVGTLANKELHKKRNRVRSVMAQYNEVSGSIYYETVTKVANLLGKDALTKDSVAYFTEQECNTVIHALLEAMKKISAMTIRYPKCHKDFMNAIHNGMRLRIVKDLTQKQNKRLLKPAQIGDTSFTVIGKGGETETFNFPKGLAYRFENNILKIAHPSGAEDEYIMYPPEFRTTL